MVEQALSHDQAALRLESKDPTHRELYRTHRTVLAELYGVMGDHAKAADAADELVRASYEPAKDACTAARVIVRCAGTALADERLIEADQTRLARSYADRAMAHLQTAAQHGFKDVTRLRQDHDFEALRSRDDFRLLLQQLDTGRRP